MKTKFTKVFAKCAIVALSCFAGVAHAATFTAVSSGSWSSTSTWSGGMSPGSTISGIDNVVINSGVTVTMDMDITVNSLLSYIQVNGTLTSTSSAHELNINSGDLSGNGTLNLTHLRLGTFGGMSFTGTANIDNLHNNNAGLSLVNQLTLNDTLFLDAGNLTFGSGGYLTLQTNSVIRVADGSITLGSGVVNNSNNHSVVYVGSSKNAGFELSGTGLSHVWITLDDNTQTLSLSGSMTINGDLHHNTGMLDLNGGSLTLMGDYDATSGVRIRGSSTSDLTLSHAGTLSSELMFDASADQLNELVIENDGGSVSIGSDLTINGELSIEEGDLIFTSGTLIMADGSEIEIGDGHLMMSGGTFDGANDYSVTYNGSESNTSGVELTGSGMSSLTIDMENETDSVEIMNSLTIDGTFSLQNGTFDMNGYDMIINGSFTGTSHGWFNGNTNSDLTFATGSLANDTIWFNDDNSIGDLTINTTDGSYLNIGTELRVEDLNLTSGGVVIWNGDLWIKTGGSITGADQDNYVMTMGTGTLNMMVSVSTPHTMFPVGSETSYSPVGLQQNAGVDRHFSVNVDNGVWSAGTTGTNSALTQSVVDRTWYVRPTTLSGSFDVNMRVQWDASMEVNGFDRTNAYISHYTSSAWDIYTTGSATSVSGGMYQLERTNITTFSPFAVVDENATVTVAELGKEQSVQMYPNPVHDVLTCIANINEVTTVDLVDLTGKVVYSERLSGTGTINHTIDCSSLPRGVYFVRYTNATGTTSYKIVKS